MLIFLFSFCHLGSLPSTHIITKSIFCSFFSVVLILSLPKICNCSVLQNKRSTLLFAFVSVWHEAGLKNHPTIQPGLQKGFFRRALRRLLPQEVFPFFIICCHCQTNVCLFRHRIYDSNTHMILLSCQLRQLLCIQINFCFYRFSRKNGG